MPDDEVPPEPEPTEVTDGPVVETEPMTLNLADGHYLKVGVALQLAAPGERTRHGPGRSLPRSAHLEAL